jgi:hypothetical protein
MVLADAIIPSAVRRLIIGLHSFFLWDFQALDVRGKRGLCSCVIRHVQSWVIDHAIEMSKLSI